MNAAVKKPFVPADIPPERRWRISGTDVIDQFYHTANGRLTSVGRDVNENREPRPLPDDHERVWSAWNAAMLYLGRLPRVV